MEKEVKKTKRRAATAEGDGGALPSVIVGIGASAGGIEALGRLFDGMLSGSGAAFVVVLHLDPTRESQLAQILATHTAMPVVQIEDGMRVEPDRVYVIAPDKYLKLRNGRLSLSEPPEPRGHRHPVDVLFRSLAEHQGKRMAAIVLSGTGTNGTDGLKTVRAEGGLIMVQDPATAKFDGMPRSAIAAGVADHIVAPEAMPELLMRFLHHHYVAEAPATGEAGLPEAPADIDQILDFLRLRAGRDFRGYKRSTLQRRIHRRLSLGNIETLTGYLGELRDSPQEAAKLVGDLMINVTGFFRDPEAWKTLAEAVLTPTIAERDSESPFRGWVPACSTGEEAYSLAMLVSELAAAAGKQFDVKIFATDSQEDNLRKARDGVYPQAAVDGMAAERLLRFFDKLDGSYQVKKSLRDMIVFAPHNLLRDPPFSRLDLVSCRNLLIYLEPEMQQRVLALIHFALRQGGYLFLGNAETVGRANNLFDTVSKKWRIYRRLGPTRHDIVDFPVLHGARPAPQDAGAKPPPAEFVPPAAETARRALLDRFAPASVAIDRQCRVLYYHGSTGDYLEQPSGEPTSDLFAMARDGLAGKLRAAVRESMATNRSVTFSARVRHGKISRPVAVTAAPLPSGANLTLVSFENETDKPSRKRSPSRPEPAQSAHGEQALQEELTAMRAELRSTIEHLETANEELKAANEEATSMNEELQSTNEELETSKEELQSFNEELHTVNSQLQHKVRELENITNDLNNLLAGTETATLFVDTDLCIKWFSPATQALFDFVASDIGRPIAHFARKFADENLIADAQAVLSKLITLEAEVRTDKARWFLRRMLPYRTKDNRIAGVVVTFTDVTEIKRANDAINEARIYAEAVVDTVRHPLLILDGRLHVVSANPAFWTLFQVSPAETQGQLLYEVGTGDWDIPRLRILLGEVLSKDLPFSEIEIEHNFRGIGWRVLLLSGRKLARGGGREELILLAFEDITERRRSDKALRESESQYRMLFNSIDEGFCIIEKIDTGPGEPSDFRYLDVNPAFDRQTGVSGVAGKTIREAFPGEPQEWFDTYDAVLKDGNPVRFERGLVTKGRFLELYAFRLDDGMHRRVAVIFQDITERKRAEAHRNILVRELNHRVKNTLATVQSIAAHTLGKAPSMAEAREALESRLMALARSHDLLTQGNWAGTELASVVRQTVAPHAMTPGRFDIEGPAVALQPAAALAFSMALHELCTNAAKYGALSSEAGRVKIVWQVTGDGEGLRLKLSWTESGGPPVTPPSHKGFGSRLIERALAMELNGKVGIDYRPSGLVCTIDAPLPPEPTMAETDENQRHNPS